MSAAVIARRLLFAALLGAASTAPVATAPAAPMSAPADLVLRGGRVQTMDAADTVASAVAVIDGRIVWVGDAGAASDWIGPDTEVIEIGAGMLAPGFQDAHVHPLSGGVELGECDLNDQPDAAAIRARIAECAATLPPGAWLRGGGWALPAFPGGNPKAVDLDALSGDRPAFLSSADGHNAWVNSAALRLAGIDASTPDPPAGRIERDAAGRPTGTLRETASSLVARHMPPHTDAELAAGLQRGLHMAASVGITALQEASASPAMVRVYADFARRGELTARVSVSLQADTDRGPEQVPELVRLRRQYDGLPMLRVATVKIFADGVIEGTTASLLEPYVDRPGYLGEPNLERAAMIELVCALDAVGFQVHVHAIGDRAIRDTLDAFEEARRRNGARDARHHIAHAQLIHPDDLPRFARLGVSANFSPLWAYADTYVTELTDPVIGPVRARWQYPIGELVRDGASVVFGSDWTVSSMNPLLGMQVGVTRVDPNGEGDAWLPEHAADLPAMLRGYTREAARVNFLDATTGSIEVGKAADLVLLDTDLFAVSPLRIGAARVLATWVQGEVVYQAQ